MLLLLRSATSPHHGSTSLLDMSHRRYRYIIKANYLWHKMSPCTEVFICNYCMRFCTSIYYSGLRWASPRGAKMYTMHPPLAGPSRNTFLITIRAPLEIHVNRLLIVCTSLVDTSYSIWICVQTLYFTYPAIQICHILDVYFVYHQHHS